MPLLSCFTLLSCTPKNEEVTNEQIEVGSANEVLDTIANTRKDGLQTDENNITPTFPLPQPVMQLLTKRYPAWEEPAYTEVVLEQAEGNLQGPGIVRGDFNGDNLQDYALQLQQKKHVIIVAALQKTEREWQLHEIKKDVLFNERGVLKSPYLLSLTEKGTELKHLERNQEIKSPYKAVSVVLDETAVTYLYEKGKFVPYTTD